MSRFLACSGRLDSQVTERSAYPTFACPDCRRSLICIDVASGVLSKRYRLTPAEAQRTLVHSAIRVGSTAHAVAADVIEAAAAGLPVALP